MRINILIVILLSCCLCLTAFAQDTGSSTSSSSSDKRFNFGLKVVGNTNKFEETKWAFGYGGGGFVIWNLSDMITIKSEVMYISYAGKLENDTLDFEGGGIIDKVVYSNLSLRFNSIEIPVMVRLSPFGTELMKPIFVVGGAYSYNYGVFRISDNIYTLFDSEGGTRDTVFNNSISNVSSNFSEYNISVLAGVEMGLTDNLSVDLRYQQGLPNLNLQNLPTSIGAIHSHTISLGLSFTF
jgi:opacity protein-like surface antigen